ncbi:MAG: histidine phosphatase family protein [Cytophagales bacterium]|nr:histidine phosphatase family protein [Cytophagales bacterium]
MRLSLIRHTKPRVDEGVCYGQADLPVDEESFEEEAKLVDQHLTSSVEVFWTSPLIRCRRLADYLCAVRNRPLHVEPLLKEMNFGRWEEKKWTEIPRSETEPWIENMATHAPPEGESLGDLVDRLKLLLRRWKGLPYHHVAAVTHGGVIRILLSLTQQKDLSSCMEIPVLYGTCHETVLV